MSYNTSEALVLLVIAYLVILLPRVHPRPDSSKRRCAVADLGINVIFEGRNLVRILEGLGVTVGISALSVVLSLVLGVFVGLGMRSRWRPCAGLMQLYLEFVRIMPTDRSPLRRLLRTHARRGDQPGWHHRVRPRLHPVGRR